MTLCVLVEEISIRSDKLDQEVSYSYRKFLFELCSIFCHFNALYFFCEF